MNKREKKRKLHGSVLLTVVCVMSLLIIFLFGTLALATAANNRAHVNYSTAQTEVTSRTVVDAAIKALESNKDYGNAVSKIGSEGSSNMMRINVELGSNVPDAGKYGDISPVSIQLAGKKKFYDSTLKQWIDGDIVKFTSTVSMAGVDSTTSAYIVKQPPNVESGDGGGAGFVTTASANINCQTNLFGGSYINLPRLGVDTNGNKAFDTGDEKGAVFYDYKYRTDEEYANWESDPTIYRQFDSNGSFSLTNANSDYSVETDLYVNNNFKIIQSPNWIFSKKGTGITVWGDMIFAAASDERGEMAMPFDKSKLKFNEVPYIYVDGALKIQNKVKLGRAGSSVAADQTNANPLNIFCGYIESTAGDGLAEIGADVYCMNPDKESVFSGSGTKLYKWSGSVINKGGVSGNYGINGSIYSKGNVNLSSIEVAGDVRVEGDCTIGSGATIKGDLVVGGTLNIDNNATVEGTIYYNPEKNSFTNKEPLKKEDVIKRNFIEHGEKWVPRNGVEELENAKRYYFKWIPGEHTNEFWQGTDVFGDVVNSDIWTPFYYEWQDDKTLEDLNNAIDSGEAINYHDYFKSSPYVGYNSRPMAIQNVDYSTEYYYVETDVVYNEDGSYYLSAKSKRTNQKTFLYDHGTQQKLASDDNSAFVKIEAYKSVPDKDGHERNPILKLTDLDPSLGYNEGDNQVFINRKNNEVISKIDGQNAENGIKPKKRNYKKINDNDSIYKTQKIYPECAERDVILGLKQIGTTDVSDTKIIKRIEEVLDSNSKYYVANPYQYDTLPSNLSDIYNNDLIPNINVVGDKQIKFSKESDIVDVVGNIASITGTSSYKPEAKPANVNDNLADGKGIYIDRSCILDNLGFSNGYSENIVINPGGDNILIVIRGTVNVGDGIKMIVDDSSGGTVNFYIESGAKFNFDKGLLTTIKYETVLRNNNGKSLAYNSPKHKNDENVYDISKIGKPKVNIYGVANSEMNVGNSKYIVANILSPNIKFTMSAGSSDLSFDKIYYNDVDIKHPVPSGTSNFSQYVFGCLNAQSVDVPNQLNVIFITDPKTDPNIPDPSGEGKFNYRLLYYDEY